MRWLVARDLRVEARQRDREGLERRERVPEVHRELVLAHLCGNQASSALQFGVSRGLSEVLLAPVGRVYLSEIVSEFEPKTWPRCRDSVT